MELKVGLYIVSTPIGNLDDITLRALFVLKNCDLIYCEDTRSTNKLLVKHGITSKKLAIYNDHSEESDRIKIASFIQTGKKVALVSDAGTPLISDPGYKLIRSLQQENIHIDVIPGACAAISALVLSGLPTDKFYFGGFMPKTQPARQKLLLSLQDINATLIFYDAPNRILDSLNAILEAFGNREIAVVREITKIFQQTIRKPVTEIIANINELKLKGEFVLLINPHKVELVVNEQDIINFIMDMKKNSKTNKDIAEILITKYPGKFSKNDIYKLSKST